MGLLAIMSAVPLTAVLVTACGGGEMSRHAAVRDSAGVRIIENAEPPRESMWTVGEQPVLTVGAGEDSVSLGMVAGVIRLADGTVAVADAFARQVRFFAPDGEHSATAGRRGGGPGEFETIGGIWALSRDSVAVYDTRLLRFTVIAHDGGVGRTVRLAATGERARSTPVGWLPGGRLVAESDAREITGREYYRARISIMSYAPDGAVTDTIVTVPGVEMWDWVWEAGTTPMTIPFGRTTTVRVHGDRIYVGANEGYQVDEYDDTGQLVGRIRLDRDAEPLGAEVIEAYKEEERAKARSGVESKGGNELFGRMAEAATYPERLPYYADLLVDRDGRLWVRDYRLVPGTPTRFIVFDSGGWVRARAEMPAEFTPTDIGGGLVTGIWRDELDVESVRVYELIER
jgi:hypothetical protein